MKHDSIHIIGGGVIGLSCAWRLAQKGLDVSVIEQRKCGQGASSASLGALWPSTSIRNTPLSQLHRQSLAMFPAMIQELEAETNRKTGYQSCGRLELIDDETHWRKMQKEIECLNQNWNEWSQPPFMRCVSPESIPECEPSITRSCAGAILCCITAKVDPALLIEALKQCCLSLGVNIQEGTSVIGLQESNGKITELNTINNRIPIESLLLASGAWTSLIDPIAKQQAPVRPVRGQALLIRTQKPLIQRIIKNGSIYLVPKDETHIMVGATTEPEAGFDESTTERGINGLLDGTIALLPQLKEGNVMQAWSGLRPQGIDKRPFIGQSPTIENLYAATGHFKLGIGLAPITAKLIAELISDRIPFMNQTFFALGRKI